MPPSSDTRRTAYLRLTRRGLHHKAAICAVGTKLQHRIYAILRDGVDYRVLAEERIRNKEKPVRESVYEVAQALLRDKPDAASARPSYPAQQPAARTALAGSGTLSVAEDCRVTQLEQVNLMLGNLMWNDRC